MNDEIKEILDKLQKVANRETASRNALMEMKDKDYQLLLDYITNLEQKCENQRLELVSLNDRLKEVKKSNGYLKQENEELIEDNYAYHQLMKIQNKREYRSKFLKEFQEEFGTNVFPDYDEIYKRYDKLKKENERLKNGYCELKVKCNNGECDCTNEEYDGMVQANMKNYLLLEDYKSRIDKAIRTLETLKGSARWERHLYEVDKLLNILQGSDDNE